MEQDIIKPDNPPKPGSQAFSPLGCFLAAFGVTLLALCKLGAAMVATVWAASKLFGLPDFMMYGLMVLGAFPVLWATAWTAGRAWHVERRLAQHLDVDTPVFRLGFYFNRSELR
ncbi:MAG: hypothetical protein HY245_05535 [Rhizobiales bacterium]|nr:hypothetical protein [Hyphomicrobiales bacterium]MBI3672873.1 hypothetical protein [Hyphomicrobiales bacterium]